MLKLMNAELTLLSQTIQAYIANINRGFKDNTTISIQKIEKAVEEIEKYVVNNTYSPNINDISDSLIELNNLIVCLYKFKKYCDDKYQILSLFEKLFNICPHINWPKVSLPSQPNKKLIVTASSSTSNCNTKCHFNINRCKAFTNVEKCPKKT